MYFIFYILFYVFSLLQASTGICSGQKPITRATWMLIAVGGCCLDMRHGAQLLMFKFRHRLASCIHSKGNHELIHGHDPILLPGNLADADALQEACLRSVDTSKEASTQRTRRAFALSDLKHCCYQVLDTSSCTKQQRDR